MFVHASLSRFLHRFRNRKCWCVCCWLVHVWKLLLWLLFHVFYWLTDVSFAVVSWRCRYTRCYVWKGFIGETQHICSTKQTFMPINTHRMFRNWQCSKHFWEANTCQNKHSSINNMFEFGRMFKYVGGNPWSKTSGETLGARMLGKPLKQDYLENVLSKTSGATLGARLRV